MTIYIIFLRRIHFHILNEKKIEGTRKNGQTRETDNIGYTRHKTKTNKQKAQTKQHSTLCYGHHYAQTTGGKDELNIVLC
jgi:hypothetical protein